MIYRLLADATVWIHVGFVAFVVLGGLTVLWRRSMVWLHLPAAIWGFLVAAMGWYCPLTDLENLLRRRAGQAGYPGGFVEHYLLPILYPAGLTREIQGVLAALVLGINGGIYGWILWRRRSAPSSPRGSGVPRPPGA
ncbi:MAG: DUF2784 domain-containing protein [Acidobacteriota bacterium]